MEPLISVIIPVYQVAAYLRNCVESVIRQSYKNLEILIVDDGSTDGSEDICEQLAKTDTRIKVIHQRNMGLSAARNTGIEAANGEYLVFVDSDDWIAGNFIKTLYCACKETESDIVQCDFWDTIDEFENQERREETVTDIQVYSPKEFSCLEYALLSWKCTVTWNKIYKYELFDKIRFPVDRLHEDEFTTYKLVWNARKIAVISTRLYFYRKRKGSIMSADYNVKRLAAGIAFEERYEFYRQMQEYELALLTRDRHLRWAKQNLVFVQKLGDEVILSNMQKTIKKLEDELEEAELLFTCYQNRMYLFPFNRIERGEKILLYGAGNIGKLFYRQILSSNYCRVLAWVDAKAPEYRKWGLPVNPTDTISRYREEADRIVIAVENLSTAKSIIEMLVKKYHIKINKIVYEMIPV